LLLQASLPLGADDRVWFGFALGITFLLSLTALPACRSRGECAASILAVVSTATIFALERANLDIVIFLMAVLGIWLVVRTDGWRFLGYGIFVLAAAAKFYPAVLLVLAVRERPRVAFAAGVFILAAIGLLTLLGTGNGAGSSVMVPVGNPFKDMFGARNLPLVMGLLIAPADGLSADQILEGPLALPGKILMSVMLLGTAWIASRSVRRDRTNWEVLGHAEAAFLVAGAALITGCFFAAQNVGYRAIFLLLVLPALFALSRTGKSDGGHRAYLVLIIGVVLLMWEEFFHHLEVMLQPAVSQIILPQSFEFGFWLGRELLWWWVIARLIALLAAFGLSSPFFLNLRGLTERSRQGNRSFRA
jgi:hypothetical protein